MRETSAKITTPPGSTFGTPKIAAGSRAAPGVEAGAAACKDTTNPSVDRRRLDESGPALDASALHAPANAANAANAASDGALDHSQSPVMTSAMAARPPAPAGDAARGGPDAHSDPTLAATDVADANPHAEPHPAGRPCSASPQESAEVGVRQGVEVGGEDAAPTGGNAAAAPDCETITAEVSLRPSGPAWPIAPQPPLVGASFVPKSRRSGPRSLMRAFNASKCAPRHQRRRRAIAARARPRSSQPANPPFRPRPACPPPPRLLAAAPTPLPAA